MRGTSSAALRILATVILIVTMATSCGDGTPKFCSDLRGSKKLDGIVSALKDNDLKRAAGEAQRLRDLSSKAPVEIRSDLMALANGVVDIIDLVERDHDANSVTDKGGQTRSSSPSSDGGRATVDNDTQDDLSVATPPPTEPTDVEQRRNELNSRLGALDKKSQKVSSWALEECGIAL